MKKLFALGITVFVILLLASSCTQKPTDLTAIEANLTLLNQQVEVLQTSVVDVDEMKVSLLDVEQGQDFWSEKILQSQAEDEGWLVEVIPMLQVGGDETDISDLIHAEGFYHADIFTFWASGEIPSGEGYTGTLLFYPKDTKMQTEFDFGGVAKQGYVEGIGQFKNEVDMDRPIICQWIQFGTDEGNVYGLTVKILYPEGGRDVLWEAVKGGSELIKLHYSADYSCTISVP